MSGLPWTQHVPRLLWRRDLVHHAATASQLIHPSRLGARLGAGGGGLRRGQGRGAPGYGKSLHALASDDGAALYYPVADHGSGAPELSRRQNARAQGWGLAPGLMGTGLCHDSADAPGLSALGGCLLFQYVPRRATRRDAVAYA